MSLQFESEKNRKAFLYTGIICALIVLAALISWKVPGNPPPIVEELIEINLGNDEEGIGDVQPLIKGDKAPDQESADQQMTANNTPPKEAVQDDNEEKDAAPVTKTETPVTKPTVIPKQQTVATKPTAVVTPTPKPQKPKIAGYNGKIGTGNGATEDNGYKYEGNNPNGKGDNGSPNGHPDSYGKNPGGKLGGLNVIGDRKVVTINNYIFPGDLGAAKIVTKVKVSPDGRGTLLTSNEKGTTTNDPKYRNAIINQILPNVKFDKSDHESIVTIPFNFTVTN